MEVEPRSMPLVAIHIRWDDTRFSSTMSMRIHTARGGISTSSSASVAREKTSSLCSGAR